MFSPYFIFLRVGLSSRAKLSNSVTASIPASALLNAKENAFVSIISYDAYSDCFKPPTSGTMIVDVSLINLMSLEEVPVHDLKGEPSGTFL
jgi:hypothetical protein